MKQFLVKLVFKIEFHGGKSAPQFDEQMRLVEARSAEDAFHRARALGAKEQETFAHRSGEIISWKFIDVSEVYALESVRDGQQICSTTHITDDETGFVHYVRRKSMEIQAKSLTFA